MLARRLGDEPGVDAVDGRLIHGGEDFRQIGAEFLVGHGADRVPGAILPSDHAGQRRFVVVPVAEFFVSERDGMDVDVIATHIAHHAEQRPGIDAGRKKYADRNVGDEMMAHAVEERRADARLGVARRGCRRTLRFGEYLRKRKIAFGPMQAATIDP